MYEVQSRRTTVHAVSPCDIIIHDIGLRIACRSLCAIEHLWIVAMEQAQRTNWQWQCILYHIYPAVRHRIYNLCMKLYSFVFALLDT